MNKKTVLSCIQPTGSMHLGNYFGAIQNWIKLQDKYDCFFGVVDYHAQTMHYDPIRLKKNTLNMFIELLSCGIDLDKSTVFVQSLIPEHVELSWILGCETSYGLLRRMTQFKDKSTRNEDRDLFVSSGLFTYPVLQAADILMYNADYVPVGKDQEQHLELSRNISQRFNHRFGEYFKMPEPLFSKISKLKSLANPEIKMSKSYGRMHHIGLFESKDSIKKKIMSAVTDSGKNQGSSKMSSGVENLFNLLKATGNIEDYNSLIEDYSKSKLRYGILKNTVYENIINMLVPIQLKKKEYESDINIVKDMIYQSSNKARAIAIKTLKDVKEKTGLYF